MIRKYHIHTPQTNPMNPQYRKEKPQNTDCHKTSGRQLKQSNQLLLPIKMSAKLVGRKLLKKQGPNTEPTHTMGATLNNKSTTTEPPP